MSEKFSNPKTPPYHLEDWLTWRGRKDEARRNGMTDDEWMEQEQPYLEFLSNLRREIAKETGQEWWQVDYKQMCEELGGRKTCPITNVLNDGVSCAHCGRKRSVFWEDLQKDLEDPEFREEFIAFSQQLMKEMRDE